MKIELKNLKVANHLSEETTAYSATVHIDGKPAFHASNEGRGGGAFTGCQGMTARRRPR